MSWQDSSSESGVVHVLVDTANTEGTALSGNVDVASLTPACAPRVTHDVVLCSLVNTVADGDDSVINICGAAVVDGDDTTAEVSEDVVAGGDSDIDGLLVDLVQVGSSSLDLAV